MRHLFTTVFALLFIPSALFSQDLPFELQVENSFIFSIDEDIPHWLSAQKWGTVNNEQVQNVFDVSASGDQTITKYQDLEYGINAFANLSADSYACLNELFLQYNVAGFSLLAGKRKEVIGDVYTPLSSGSMVMSGNATPIPKISAGIFDYMSVPFTRDYLQIKGRISHGWFQGDRHTEDLLLHEKSLYGKANLPYNISPYFGLIHEAMWGGVTESGIESEVTWPNFWRIFVAESGGEDATASSQINRLGNHLGIWDMGIYFTFDTTEVHTYYQHYFEDRSGLEDFKNGTDGLWGLAFDNLPLPFLTNFLYEYLKTTSQSGDAHDVDGEVLGGRDSYYHHGQYANGWTHLDHVLGSSFFTTVGEDEELRIANNRMKIHHLGLSGAITERIGYKMLLSYARYYPAYASVSLYDEEEYMLHSYLELEYNGLFGQDGLSTAAGLAYDAGSLDDSFGGNLSVKWSY